MGKTKDMQSVMEELRSTAGTLNAVIESLEEMFSGSKPEEEKPPMTLPEIRGILAEKSRAGFTAEIRALLMRHGADKLSAINPAEYADLAAETEAIGNG